MTVLARSKTGAGWTRRQREASSGRGGRGSDSSVRRNEPAAGARTITAEQPAAPQHRREAGISEDHALYTCECGFVFRALVSTSVDCPHCGSSQAW